MTYEKLKQVDLNEIKSQEQANDLTKSILEMDKNDIIKYINFLRWQQFSGTKNLHYMNRIVKILSHDDIIDIEWENSNIITGETEDLMLTAVVEKEEIILNPITIDTDIFSVKAVLEDDFESIMIVSDKDDKLFKYGFVVMSGLQGVNFYAYELFEETQEYYKQIINASIGTKINVYADIVGENQVTKTFKKVDLNIEDAIFTLTKKTNKGILTPVTKEGTFSVIKKEEMLSSDGISEDRLQSQMTKLQQELQEQLSKKSCDRDIEDCEDEDEKEYTKEDFADDFKFSEKYQFSFITPNGEDFCGNGNPLNQTVLLFHDTELEETNDLYKWELNDAYVGEVYQFLYTCFDESEIMEGIWIIDNSKVERLMRKLKSAGADIYINPDGASLFLNKLLREQKLERISKSKMNIQVIKKIKTKKDIEEFAKNSGTELYVQIGQVITAVLEGTKRIYGENHIVFDSDRKLIICQYSELDLVEASNYAIDNEYDNFYVIEKDKYQQYDAWVKETINDEEDIVATPTEKESNFEKSLKESEKNSILFESSTPIDIIIAGTSGYSENGAKSEAEIMITDDYTGFSISKNNKNIISDIESDGFVSIYDVDNFIKAISDDVYNQLECDETDDIEGLPIGSYLLRNFTGKIKLVVKDNKGDIVDYNRYDINDFIQHQLQYCNVYIDIYTDITPIQIDNKVFEELKLNQLRIKKFERL